MKLASKRRYPPRGDNAADAAPFVPQADVEYPPPYWPYPPYWGMPPTPASARDKPPRDFGMHPPPYMMPPPYGYFWPGVPPSPHDNMPGSSPRRSSKNFNRSRRNSGPGPMGGDWEEFYNRYSMPGYYPYPYPHPAMQAAASSPRYPTSPRFQENRGFRTPRRGRGGGNFSPRRKNSQRFNPQRTAIVTGIDPNANKEEVRTELTGMFQDLGLHSVHVITPKGSKAIRAYLNFKSDKAAETAVSRDGTQLLDNQPLKITLKSALVE